MTYQKPELFLVGAAQGLVLGGAEEGLHPDHSNSCGLDVSRESPC
jgi:hypothetical protein